MYLAWQSSFLSPEFELVRNAMYTDPGDQSVWIYHRWLIAEGMPRHYANAMRLANDGLQVGMLLFYRLKSTLSRNSWTNSLTANVSAGFDL